MKKKLYLVGVDYTEDKPRERWVCKTEGTDDKFIAMQEMSETLKKIMEKSREA